MLSGFFFLLFDLKLGKALQERRLIACGLVCSLCSLSLSETGADHTYQISNTSVNWQPRNNSASSEAGIQLADINKLHANWLSPYPHPSRMSHSIGYQIHICGCRRDPARRCVSWGIFSEAAKLLPQVETSHAVRWKNSPFTNCSAATVHD